MAEGISIESLIGNSSYEVINYYRSQKVTAYSVGIQVFLPEYQDIENDLLTNKKFHIHLDLSKRWDSKTIDVVNLTPKMTEAGGFIEWLSNNMGYQFLAGYYKELYRVISEEHGEEIIRHSDANYF